MIEKIPTEKILNRIKSSHGAQSPNNWNEVKGIVYIFIFGYLLVVYSPYPERAHVVDAVNLINYCIHSRLQFNFDISHPPLGNDSFMSVTELSVVDASNQNNFDPLLPSFTTFNQDSLLSNIKNVSQSQKLCPTSSIL